ncbi:MAG TPA: MotA/TolQ/ExbB proton channel family protein [Bacteroidota bacterium]|nr:MotA/TolQ/ExbB proton channel family protein [Bacteroidota bacterium]
MNLLDLFLRGGVVMWPILLCSLIAAAIIIEKFIVLSRAKVDPGQLMLKIRSSVSRNDLVGAVNACSQVKAPVANILKKGVVKYKEGHEAVKTAIEGAGKEEVFYLEKRLGLLANLAGIAPMLGFLGTVTGMIAAFRTIEQLGGNVNPSNLAGGIWEAMLTTAFGLIVGIPALGFYNYFVTKVNRLVFEIEQSAEEFLDFMKSGNSAEAEQPKSRQPGAPSKRVFSEEDEFFEPKND